MVIRWYGTFLAIFNFTKGFLARSAGCQYLEVKMAAITEAASA
jgi:hypothetical protein